MSSSLEDAPHLVSMNSSCTSDPIVSESQESKTSTYMAMKRCVSSLSTGDNSTEYATKHKHFKASLVNNRGRLTTLHNARILQRNGSFLHGSITVDQGSGLIVEISLSEDDREENLDDITKVHQNSELIDCKNQIISPGFIDIQLNGAYGIDFSNADVSPRGLEVQDIVEVSHKLLATGVTSFCPTMVSSSRETYQRIMPLIREAREQQIKDKSTNKNRGANILGMHLEGPFFAPSKRGAHDNTHIFAPSKGVDSVMETYGLCTSDISPNKSRLEDIDIITMAPELEGAVDVIKSLTKPKTAGCHSVVISCGHTEATYEDGMQAVASGATLLTHLYNAMNPFHHRKPGLVGLLSSESKLARTGLERPFYSIIVDGIHVHEAAISMAYNTHPHGCVLVTDAMSAMGLGDGTHSLGAMAVDITGDRATLTGTDTLAGSVVTMDTCVRRFRQFTGCSVGEALLCATLHPAMVLKRHVAKKKVLGAGVSAAPIGVLEVGACADLVLLNDGLEVIGSLVGGAIDLGLLSKLK